MTDEDRFDVFFKKRPEHKPAPDWLKEVAIPCKSFQYNCPKCGHEHPETDEFDYVIDGEKWPIVHNYHSYGNDMGSGYDWTEYHKCEECETIYVYENGT